MLPLAALCLALLPRSGSAVTGTPLSPPTLTPDHLAQTLLGGGGGVTVSNVQFTGNPLAGGTFDGGAGSIGLDAGVVLSSGTVAGVAGPNDSDGQSTEFGLLGDADLNTLTSGGATNDAAVLEFDFVPTSSVITFTYVFGSEEYDEYANTGFNDVFGFFVNGTNLALLPDGVTPVTINTVNGGNPSNGTGPVNPAFFVGNDCTPRPCGIDMELDGRTVTLELRATVNPGVTNHLKMAIADVSDDSLDSWVFIKAGSFVVTENCSNGVDDDGDTLVDNADPNCHICGDGNADPGEQCDDGNVAAGDGCSPVCQLEGSSTTSTSGVPTTSTTSTSSTTTTSTSTSTTTTLQSCTATPECDDGDPCNGDEVCEAGFCRVQRGIGPACTANRPIAVVTAFRDDAVALVDTRTLAVEATIPVGDAPWGVAWRPDGRRVFVTNREGRSVSVIDPVGQEVVATIGVGRQPLGVAVHPFLPRAYVTNYDDGTLSVIDTNTLAVAGTVNVGRGPAAVAVHPAGGKLWVTNYIAGSLSVVDAAAERVVATVAVPDLPLGVAVHPAGTKVYVVSHRGRLLTVLGTVSDTVLSRIRVGRKPVGVAFDAEGTRAYVSNSGDDTLTVLDAARDAIVGEVPVGNMPLGVAVAASGAVWACDGDSDDVRVVDPDGGADTLTIPGAPVSMGAFIGNLPDECPAPALVCDDANPLTDDTCEPGVGCNQDPVPGVRGVGAAVDAILALANDPAFEGDALVQRVRGALPALQSAVQAAETGGGKAAIRLAQRSLNPLAKLLTEARRDGTLGPVGPQLLDIAREIRQRLRQLARA
jgi:YVTN family beta-propeller protein/cysteine-rich repeat protein